MRRLDELTDMAAREKGRLASPTLPPSIRTSVERTIRGLEREAAKVRALADAAVERLPRAQSAAAYYGLAPAEFSSGSSLRRKTRLSKRGNARLRKALFLPTQTAVRSNPALAGFFERLLAAGKPKRPAIGRACGNRS